MREASFLVAAAGILVAATFFVIWKLAVAGDPDPNLVDWSALSAVVVLMALAAAPSLLSKRPESSAARVATGVTLAFVLLLATVVAVRVAIAWTHPRPTIDGISVGFGVLAAMSSAVLLTSELRGRGLGRPGTAHIGAMVTAATLFVALLENLEPPR